MTQSASPTQDDRRRTTALRISACVQRLTDEHGLDEFTLEDLAAVAEVPRHTC